jgi:glycosyltransferase involved in cell wall biosynthesis
MSTTSQPLVSGVTPAYNEEEHLAECIESVLAQTYQNWDYTIVNNCSTDKTLEIARHYAARDPRIHVHDNQQFLPMIANHNLSMRQVSVASKYCKVVLADDWIFPECLEKMVTIGEVYPSAGVISAYQLHGEQVRSTGLPYEKSLISGREVCRKFFLQKLCVFGTQNSVLYRADFVRKRHPFYDETDKCCADWEACFALLRTSDLGFVHQVLTFSRPRASSFGAISWDMGVNFGSMLGVLFVYGRECLSGEEFEGCLDAQLSQYYRFLSRRLFVDRDRGFWSYHKRTLARLGIGFSSTRLAKAATAELFSSALEPKHTLEAMRRLFKLRNVRDVQKRRLVSSFGSDKVEDGDQTVGRT